MIYIYIYKYLCFIYFVLYNKFHHIIYNIFYQLLDIYYYKNIEIIRSNYTSQTHL